MHFSGAKVFQNTRTILSICIVSGVMVVNNVSLGVFLFLDCLYLSLSMCRRCFYFPVSIRKVLYMEAFVGF